MTIKISAILILSFVFTHNTFSQSSKNFTQGNQILELKSRVLKSDSTVSNKKINTSVYSSKKSPLLATVLSLIIPGSGHLYLNRFDVGKYFFGIDVASWIGYVSLNAYGNDVIDDAKTFSHEHAGVSQSNVNSDNDDYFSNVGNYYNIFDYNNAQLQTGNYSGLYNTSEFYWNWDNTNNQNIFETQRKNSERIYNSRIIFGSILIANRIVAGISAYLLATKDPKKTTSLNIEPQLLYKNDLTFDGVKINLSKNF